MLGGIGIPELVIVLVIILVIFGAGKLPEIGGGMGKAIRNFKRSLHEEEKPWDIEQNGVDHNFGHFVVIVSGSEK